MSDVPRYIKNKVFNYTKFIHFLVTKTIVDVSPYFPVFHFNKITHSEIIKRHFLELKEKMYATCFSNLDNECKIPIAPLNDRYKIRFSLNDFGYSCFYIFKTGINTKYNLKIYIIIINDNLKINICFQKKIYIVRINKNAH